MTFQLEQKGRNTNETGYSSARRVREYLYHPDTIKSLKTGEAIYMSKDTNVHTKLNIHKPF